MTQNETIMDDSSSVSSKPIDSMSYEEIIIHKESINARLKEVALPQAPNTKERKKSVSSHDRTKPSTLNSSRGKKIRDLSTNVKDIPKSSDADNAETEDLDMNAEKIDDEIVRVIPKVDVQWDFLMKEMMWLAADFQSERKRQVSKGKKIAGAVRQFHNTKETRRLRELAEAEAKRRRLAAKLARDVKTWWTKIEKIITFQQKLEANELKQKRMDKHLVFLVKQTERYSMKLNEQLFVTQFSSESDKDKNRSKFTPESPCKNTRSRSKQNPKYIPHSTQHIEDALAASTIDSRTPIKSSNKNKIKKAKIKNAISNGSRPKHLPHQGKLPTDDSTNLTIDTQEIPSTPSPPPTPIVSPKIKAKYKNMHEEERSFSQSADGISHTNSRNTPANTNSLSRRVTFAPTIEDPTPRLHNNDNQNDKNSVPPPIISSFNTKKALAYQKEQQKQITNEYDQSSYDSENSIHIRELFLNPSNNFLDDEDDISNDSIDFVENEINSLDDESTLEAEEKMARDMTYKEEIDLLKQEAQLSVDEIVAKYNITTSFQSQISPPKNEVNVIANSYEQKGAKREIHLTPCERIIENDLENTINNNDRSSNEKLQTNKIEGKKNNKLQNNLSDSLRNNEILPKEPYKTSQNKKLKTSALVSNINEGLKASSKLKRKELDSSLPSASITTITSNLAKKATLKSTPNRTQRQKSKRKRKLTQYATKYQSKQDISFVSNGDLEIDNDDEYDQNAAENLQVDDETTIEIEERLGRDMSSDKEISLLQEEAEIPLDVLKAMYSKMQNENSGESEKNAHDKDNHHSNSVEYKVEEKTKITGTKHDLLSSIDGNDNVENEEFSPGLEAEVDDETTLEAEEKLGRDMSYSDEIKLLESEGEIPIEELLEMHAKMQDSLSNKVDVNSETKSDEKLPFIESCGPDERRHERSYFDEENDTGDDEFDPNSHIAVDDETTIAAEEKLGREMSYDEEIKYLKRESEISIEELRAMYSKMNENICSKLESLTQQDCNPRGTKHGLDKNANSDLDEVSTESSPKRKKTKVESTPGKRKLETETITGHDDPATEILNASDDRIHQMVVSRPFLLAPWLKLREYQQIGLNWLVSIQSRRLNGILADEMGLGKTLQTISLLSYLASYKGIWGPHLIIVPTSCIVNWEVELKRFCPAFKILCYHGSAKRRKELRQGWTKSNLYHVVITSYQLAVQDAFAFKRKCWYYLVLDEAQNIKNFQSQRWQTLITFNTQRRLLLTGTPLQNNLMELWSLLHFLMPHIFRSRKEFSYWFSNPMNHIIEGNASRNDSLIGRLHGIIRPFVLRRLKKDVETQMPGKYEHVVQCQLSRRQMFLYEEFISRSSTKMALRKGGNFMGMMNVLMQLRKVCNHPDLFEPRSVITPFCMEPLSMTTASIVINATDQKSSLEKLSQHLLHPLWTISCGIPSFDNSTKHDCILKEQISDLEIKFKDMMMTINDDCIREPKPDAKTKQELNFLLEQIWSVAKDDKEHVIRRNANINHWRCQSQSFPYPDRLLDKIQIVKRPIAQNDEESNSVLTVASTPSELLAMKKSQMNRAIEMDEVISKFVFCVPKAGSSKARLHANAIDIRSSQNESLFSSQLMKPFATHFRTFRKANSRLNSFFPDKKLIQFDAGKLQALSVLLRNLKRGSHRCLIFTQMSKMLDIFEAFLNLNGHTYLRLDGSTSVEARQRLMDRFNSDEKIFCFILSTRSGGLGINLTGADTVIFYDSDWNPAMDAQAQDRAHRIGQTRDVHIYRLVTEHTIEENILLKAKQKRQLDFLVMDEGKFSVSNAQGKPKSNKNIESEADKGSVVFTKAGLRDILGVRLADDDSSIGTSINSTSMIEEASRKDNDQVLSKEQMENAMAVLEDEDDVKAMRGAQKEAAEKLKEFDETVQFQKDNDLENDSLSQYSQDDDIIDDEQGRQNTKSATSKGKGKEASKNKSVSPPVTTTGTENNDSITNDAQMEKEFAAWQKKVGIDMKTISESLKPTERYGKQFKEDIDPFYSIHYDEIEELLQEDENNEEELAFDIDEIEKEKEAQERQVIEDGDLLATCPSPESLPQLRNVYLQEKVKLRNQKKRRKLTGENWCTKIDGTTKLPFWYNKDTGEAIWEKPTVLLELEADRNAHENKWISLPAKPLYNVMSFLLPYPDRINCSKVCRQWRIAATDISFVKHVFPVEMSGIEIEASKLNKIYFRTISDALATAVPGDTIELGDGHYWINDPGLSVNFPLRIVGDENDPSHVVLELRGSIIWKGHSGWMEGVTIRRPKMASEKSIGKEILRIEEKGRIDMAFCVFDNEGGTGDVTKLSGQGSKGKWHDVLIKNATIGKSGLLIDGKATLLMDQCRIMQNGGNGLTSKGTAVTKLSRCKIRKNNGYGIDSSHKSIVELNDTILEGNSKGDSITIDESNVSKNETLSSDGSMSKLSKKKLPDKVPSVVLDTKSDNNLTTSLSPVQSKQSIKVKEEKNGKINSKQEAVQKRRPNTRKKQSSIT